MYTLLSSFFKKIKFFLKKVLHSIKDLSKLITSPGNWFSFGYSYPFLNYYLGLASERGLASLDSEHNLNFSGVQVMSEHILPQAQSLSQASSSKKINWIPIQPEFSSLHTTDGHNLPFCCHSSQFIIERVNTHTDLLTLKQDMLYKPPTESISQNLENIKEHLFQNGSAEI